MLLPSHVPLALVLIYLLLTSFNSQGPDFFRITLAIRTGSRKTEAGMRASEVSGLRRRMKRKNSNPEGGAFFSIRNTYEVECVPFLAFQFFFRLAQDFHPIRKDLKVVSCHKKTSQI